MQPLWERLSKKKRASAKAPRQLELSRLERQYGERVTREDSRSWGWGTSQVTWGLESHGRHLLLFGEVRTMRDLWQSNAALARV